MKKWYSGMAALALLTMIFYGVLAGKPFLQMAAGPQEELGGRGFEQLEGEYIAYEVTHPVVSYVEEYYSGDSERISKMAYVTYEEERPVPVNGSLTEITDADEIREILEAMTGSESASTAEMNALAQAQPGWYRIELGYIGGISGANLSICAVAAGAALLVLAAGQAAGTAVPKSSFWRNSVHGWNLGAYRGANEGAGSRCCICLLRRR